MIEKTIILKSFNELNEDDQQKVLEKHYNINTDYDWYDYLLETCFLENGIKVTSFDTYYGNIDGELTEYPAEVKKRILKNFSKNSYFYETVKSYDLRRSDFNEDDFKYQLLTDCLSILKTEYDYLTSEESIKETILCNDYHFNDQLEIDS